MCGMCSGLFCDIRELMFDLMAIPPWSIILAFSDSKWWIRAGVAVQLSGIAGLGFLYLIRM